MSFSTLILLCMLILTATHVLDGTIRRTESKKGFFLLFLIACFSASLLPSWTFNRYLSVNVFFVLSVVFYLYLVFKRRGRPESLKLSVFFLYAVLLYVLQMVWEVTVNTDVFYYMEMAATALYCILLIPRPGDAALCAYFGIWFLQLLSIVKNVIVDTYVYFDLASPEVMRHAMFTALFAFILSDFLRYLKSRGRYRKQAV